MNIPIKVNINNFYKTLLLLMHRFPLLRELRERELDVLAEIMFQNYDNRAIKDFDKRQLVVFSQESKTKMCTRLGLAEANLNDYFSKLRKKGVIQGKKLIPFFNILPDKEYNFNIKFLINE